MHSCIIYRIQYYLQFEECWFRFYIQSKHLCCRCPAEYTGELCQYRNPCHGGEQICQNGGTCVVIQQPGRAPSFQCTCPLGFTNSLCEVKFKSLTISVHISVYTSCSTPSF